jgi:phosphatidylethanolamine/phosphatidyl-N-methylethanolamine N-methyltransferase
VQKIKLYDESAPVYHRRYRHIQRKKYQAIAPFLTKGPIIDVGVGTGIGLPSLFGLSPIVGVDGAIEMIRFAANQLQDLKDKYQDVSLVCAFAEALPFRDCSFPTVISVTMIQNVAEIQKGIAELVRILQRTGLCVVTSLAKVLPLSELESKIKANFIRISQFENLADEDDGVVFQLS